MPLRTVLLVAALVLAEDGGPPATTQPAVDARTDTAPDARDAQGAQPDGSAAAAPDDESKSPAQVAKTLRHLGQFQDSKPLSDAGDYVLWYAKRHEAFHFKAPTGEYSCAVLGPKHGLDDVEASLTLTLRPNDKRDSKWAKVFSVGFVDLDDPRPEGVMTNGRPGGFLGIAIYADEHDSRAEVYHAAGTLAMRLPCPVKVDGSQSALIRLIHCAGGNEIRVDETRLAYMPDPPGPRPRRVGLYLKTVGMNAKVERFRFDRLAGKEDAQK